MTPKIVELLQFWSEGFHSCTEQEPFHWDLRQVWNISSTVLQTVHVWRTRLSTFNPMHSMRIFGCQQSVGAEPVRGLSDNYRFEVNHFFAVQAAL